MNGAREAGGYKLGIVVLAYNHVQDTLECLRSLRRVSYPRAELILVDNGSTDKTAEIVRKQFPEITILRLDPNEGIARGYNHGLQYGLDQDHDFMMVLNNDTVVDPQFLEHMLATFDHHEDAGIVMPKIYYYADATQRIWSAGARWRLFPPSIKMIGAGSLDKPEYNIEREIDFAPSCCMLIDSQALRQIGLFDPGYYFYFDDWDLCERFRTSGEKIYFSPKALIWHKEALSTLKTDPPPKWWRVMGASSVRFFLKHKSRGTLYIHAVWIVLRESLKLNWSHVAAYLQGVRQGLRNADVHD